MVLKAAVCWTALLFAVWPTTRRHGRETLPADTIGTDEPGLTIETAIVLEDATSELNGVSAEHAYTSKHYPGWRWKTQSLVEHEGRPHDVIELVGPNGETKTIYFDITNWFGKLE